MALTRQVIIVVDSMDENGNLGVKRIIRVLDDDGSVIGERIARKVLQPGDALTGEGADVRGIANVVWTAERVAARKARDAANTAQLQPGTAP